MSLSFGFGYPSTQSQGTFEGPYTGQQYLYEFLGNYPAGNPNINGTRIVSIDNILLNGSWSATNGWRAEFHSDGYLYVFYNTSGGSGSINFTRWLGNGGTVSSSTGYTWGADGGPGGLQGNIYWSTVPGVPQSITATRSGTNVTVTTVGSADNGGSPLVSDGIQYARAGGNWVGNYDISSGTYVVRGLTPGVSYYFRTYSNNIHGSGAPLASALITIPNLPTAPSLTLAKNATSVTLTVGDTTSTDTPTYYVQQSLDNVTWQSPITVSGSPRTYTFSGLTPGQTYFYRAYATSDVGQGAYSTVQSTTIATVPGAPASISCVRAGRSVTVSMTAVTVTGGDPITSYGIQYSNDGGTTWSAATLADSNLQATFSNLTTGTTYVFRGYATNDIGNGAYVTSTGVFISGYGKRYAQAAVTAASHDGTSVTYTATGHGFSATDLVDVTGVTPATLNVTQAQITAVTANTFTIASTVTDAYTSGGTVKGFAMVLNGSRWSGTAWVPITTSQKVASGTDYSSFN